MATEYDEPISDSERVKIASNFIRHAPPGEFNEVFNDVRILLDDDNLLKEGAAGAFAEYNKSQFTSCKVEDSEEPVLITDHGDKGNGKFFDPRTKKVFKYDHLRKEAHEFQSGDSYVDQKAEPWRAALENVFTQYVHNHYLYGASSVYGSYTGGNITLIACIETHQFKPQSFWNGRWRSQWSVTFPESGGSAEVTGLVKVQVHYYEDGNVQLVSSKDIKETVKVTSEQDTAKSLVNIISEAETEYQKALNENYITMSDTTFKALRRQLPVTRTKIDWNKVIISGYKIGGELKNA